MDIWAAGVTLYYMVEFNPPFQGSTLAELYINIGKGEFRCASEQGGGQVRSGLSCAVVSFHVCFRVCDCVSVLCLLNLKLPNI